MCAGFIPPPPSTAIFAPLFQDTVFFPPLPTCLSTKHFRGHKNSFPQKTPVFSPRVFPEPPNCGLGPKLPPPGQFEKKVYLLPVPLPGPKIWEGPFLPQGAPNSQELTKYLTGYDTSDSILPEPKGIIPKNIVHILRIVIPGIKDLRRLLFAFINSCNFYIRSTFTKD